MMKEQKINYVKFWLQCFGERDNEEFFIHVMVGNQEWFVGMQYNYDSDGDQIDPYNFVSWSRKLIKNSSIDELSDENLDMLIEALKKIKINW